MVGYRLNSYLIWFLISSKVLALGIETHPHNHHQSLQGSSVVNANLLVEGDGQNLNIKHDKDDMVAMVAYFRGNYGTSGAKNQFEESKTAEGKVKCEWHLKLDLFNRYRLDWTVDYAGNEIIFALNINHTSSKFHQGSDIFALGFSENGELPSSDFCIIWYDLSHKLHLQDARTDTANRLQLIDAAQSNCKLVKFPKLDHSGNSKVASESSPRFQARAADNEDEVYDGEEIGLKGGNLPGAHETEEPIQIVFKRPLDVCAPRNHLAYYRIDNGTTHLVWFTIKGPLLSMDGLDLGKLGVEGSSSSPEHQENNQHHGEHQMKDARMNHSGDGGQFEWGMKRVQLIPTNARRQSKPSAKSSSSLDIRMDNFKVPASETTYWCKLFKLPRKFETRKYHLTEYEAVIEKGNEHVVHHMELFNCANLNTGQEQALHDLYGEGGRGGWSGDCGGADRPKATNACRKVILAWAMGAQPLVYPELVGQSIGGHDFSPYVVLEVHYNNVELTSGLMDNSGLRFHYTSKLRPYDAGILEVGLEYTDKVSIPPKLVTPIAAHCVGECTRLAMGSSSTGKSAGGWQGGAKHNPASDSPTYHHAHLEDGIYIFAAQMHTHLAGVASWTEIIREGKLVAELQRDNHYSPHFQEIRLLPSHVHLAPGDSLIHYCLYDTRKRANITLGGFATSDEMCVTYLHYYPRIDLEVCKSSVDTGALEAYFAYLAREENQNTSERLSVEFDGAGTKTVSENYHSIQWNARRSKELIQFYAHAPLSVQCNRSNGDRWPGHWSGVTPTRIWADSAEVEPFETRSPKGDQLMAYRGRGFDHRHAQCQAHARKINDPEQPFEGAGE